MNVLFVCTGNTCRSPMAEHLFRKMATEAGVADVHVSSAGTSPAMHLDFPDEARATLKAEGVDGVQHAPRRLDQKNVDEADLILTMEAHHKAALVSCFPQARAKTHVINAYAGLGSQGIPDPYGHSVRVYETVLAQIKTALEKIISKIQEQPKPSEEE